MAVIKARLLDGVEAVYKDVSELVLERDVGKMLADSFREIDCGEWRTEFTALDKLRAIAVLSPDAFLALPGAPELPELVRKIDGALQNLRSSILKNGLMLVEEIFRCMGPQVHTTTSTSTSTTIITTVITHLSYCLSDPDNPTNHTNPLTLLTLLTL
jgi:hypothetical protein